MQQQLCRCLVRFPALSRINVSSFRCNTRFHQSELLLAVLCLVAGRASAQVTVPLPQIVLEAKHTEYVSTQNAGTPDIINVKSRNPSVATATVYRVNRVQIVAVAPGKTTVEFFDTVERKLYQVPVWVTEPNASGGGGQGYNPGLTQLPQIVMLVKHTENAHTPNDAAAQISGVKSSNPSVATARTDPPRGIQIYSVALGDTWIEFTNNTTGITYQVHVWVRDKLPDDGSGGGRGAGKGKAATKADAMPRPHPGAMDKCLVGRWASDSADFNGKTSGGAGASFVVQANGNISADYKSMNKIMFPDGGAYSWRGAAAGHISAEKGLLMADRVDQSTFNFDILDAHGKSMLSNQGWWKGTLGGIFPPARADLSLTYTCNGSKLTIVQTVNNSTTTFVLARK